MLKEIGITSVEEMRRIGAIGIYRRLRFVFGRRVSLNALWAIHAGLMGRPWLSLSDTEKAKLRAELQAESES
jgi:TfoX C-terminal domain